MNLQDVVESIINILSKSAIGNISIIISGIWAVYLYRKSLKRELNSNELLNQPKFVFIDSMNSHAKIRCSSDEPDGSIRPMPDFCDNPSCDRLHLFDLKNEGNFPAEKLVVSAVLEDEQDFVSCLMRRREVVMHLQSNESLQYSISSEDLPSLYYEKLNIGEGVRFYVFLEYMSSYTKYHYKRVYQIDACKIKRTEIPQFRINRPYGKTPWARGIEFFGSAEQGCKCDKDVKFFTRLKSHRNLKNKKMCINCFVRYWLNDFLGYCRIYRLFYFVKSAKKMNLKHVEGC